MILWIFSFAVLSGLFTYAPFQAWSRIHERTVSLRFLGKILKVLRIEVSICNVYITKQFRPLLLKGEEE